MATVTKYTATLGTGPVAERDFDPDKAVVHEETCGSRTACGRPIGSWREGWRNEGHAVSCRACLRVIAAAEAFAGTRLR